MAVQKDSIASPSGDTLVRIVDNMGKPMLDEGGHLLDFATAKWSTHNSPPCSLCPVWINTIVLGPSAESARLGAHLAGLDTAGQSSCSKSEKVMALIVDETGKLTDVKNFGFALVRSLKEGLVQNDMRVAQEVWLTNTAIQTIIDNTPDKDEKLSIRAAALHCVSV